MVESLEYNSTKGCPEGYRHRKAYKSSTGKYVEPRCIKSQSIYPKGGENLRQNMTARARRRLKGVKGKLGLTQKCPKGQILRAPYVRRYSTTVRKEGFNVRRGNKTFRVYPEAKSVLVKAKCVEDKGLPGKGDTIGPLRKGELAKYGYKAQLGREARHAALKKAIDVYGPLGVFHKLDAITKLTQRTAPDAHKVFKTDREWVTINYSFQKD